MATYNAHGQPGHSARSVHPGQVVSAALLRGRGAGVTLDPAARLDASLPGADLVSRGLDDLRRGTESVEALLVAIGRPRLVRLGLEVPARYEDPELRLYERLAAENPDTAHARYNALIRRLVSFERASECAR